MQVIPRSGNEISYPNCLVVDPYREAATGDQLLATVEHFIENRDQTGFPWKILPVSEGAMSLKLAMDAALTYAQKNRVPVILVNHDDLSTDDEKRQTDTTILPLKP